MWEWKHCTIQWKFMGIFLSLLILFAKANHLHKFSNCCTLSPQKVNVISYSISQKPKLIHKPNGFIHDTLWSPLIRPQRLKYFHLRSDLLHVIFAILPFFHSSVKWCKRSWGYRLSFKSSEKWILVFTAIWVLHIVCKVIELDQCIDQYVGIKWPV